MTIQGIGTDIVDIGRVARMRYLSRAAEFVLLPEEIKEMRRSRNEVQFFASRLAAKEAVIKAHPEKLGYHDFRVSKTGKKPHIVMLKNFKDKKIFLSIAHEERFAVGVALVAN
jgi:holo-[acyl-carrier protein] synthase